MSLIPPETIHVKRKRGADADEGPVDFLQVEGNKRFRSLSGDAIWVYRRKKADIKRADAVAQASVPVIHATQEGDEKRRRKPLQKPTVRNGAGKPESSAPPVSAVALGTPNENVRRFHLSKDQLAVPTVATSRKRGAPALFVERDAKKQRNSPEPETRTPASTTQDASGNTALARSASTGPSPRRNAAQPAVQTKYKPPGRNSRTKKTTSSAKATLPPSILNRQGVDMDELARDMEAYTLNHIVSHLSIMEQDSVRERSRQMALSSSSARNSRFKPKAPSTRFAERHPEYAAERERAKAAAADMVVADRNDYSTDEDDYILETYERVPASRLRDQAVPPHRVGLLVFDTEPERTEFFFGNNDESSDECLEDEDDENAENHYTADYPEDDLDWDDQFDRNPYRYATGNGFEGEEKEVHKRDGDEDDEDDDEAWDT